jgi:glutathione S-transferase
MITLYHSVGSRAVVPLWLLLELGVAYRIADTDIRKKMQKTSGYLKINPMGKVPALDDGGVMVTEVPAICLYLADKYSYGTLAPTIEDPARGPYLKWMVFSTAVFEPGVWLPPAANARDASDFGWGHRDIMLDMLEAALTAEPWLLGDRFSAADIALGGIFAIAYFNKKIPERPAFAAYIARLSERPGFHRAREIAWPPELLKES